MYYVAARSAICARRLQKPHCATSSFPPAIRRCSGGTPHTLAQEPLLRILMPVPNRDFDPTETSVPWRLLTDAGHSVVFATPSGLAATPDERMISGKGLLFWSPLLRARADARILTASMLTSPEFMQPLAYSALKNNVFDGLILPGGHASGMQEYLEDEHLQTIVVDFFREHKPIGAICHGTVLAARSVDPQTGRSVLDGRRTTGLTRSMELSAWLMTPWLGRYYRTYPQTVQAEVQAACGGSGAFLEGPFALLRDSPTALHRGFVVEDSNYISARWPGDAYAFSTAYLALLAR